MCTHTHTQTPHAYTHIHTHMHTYNANTQECMHVHKHTYTNKHTYMQIQMHTRMHTYIPTNRHIQIQKHTHTHRLQLSRNLRESPDFLEFVPGPGMLHKLSWKSPYPQVYVKNHKGIVVTTWCWKNDIHACNEVSFVWCKWRSSEQYLGRVLNANKLFRLHLLYQEVQ